MKLRRLLLTCNYLKLSDGIILSILVKSLIEVVLFILNMCCNNRTESFVTISATRYHPLSRFLLNLLSLPNPSKPNPTINSNLSKQNKTQNIFLTLTDLGDHLFPRHGSVQFPNQVRSSSKTGSTFSLTVAIRRSCSLPQHLDRKEPQLPKDYIALTPLGVTHRQVEQFFNIVYSLRRFLDLFLLEYLVIYYNFTYY